MACLFVRTVLVAPEEVEVAEVAAAAVGTFFVLVLAVEHAVPLFLWVALFVGFFWFAEVSVEGVWHSVVELSGFLEGVHELSVCPEVPLISPFSDLAPNFSSVELSEVFWTCDVAVGHSLMGLSLWLNRT